MAHVLMIKGGMNEDLDMIVRGQNLANMAIEIFYQKCGLLCPYTGKSLYTMTGLLFEEYSILAHTQDSCVLESKLNKMDSLSTLNIEIHRKIYAEQNDRLLYPIRQRASILSLMHQFDEAEDLMIEALMIAEKENGKNSLAYISTKERLAEHYFSRKEYLKVIPILLDLREWWSEYYGEDYFVTLRICLSLANAFYLTGEYHNSELVLLPAYQTLLKEHGVEHSNTQSALLNLVNVYEAWGYPDKARPYRALLIDQK